ncbi:glutaminase [Parasphingorhabdus sp. DH2-15]|uniref:glutaminase n=1 Tax=Parasphingorhabdus sp. DH2-15 TaxID=3444112 RepID=UPI003F682310
MTDSPDWPNIMQAVHHSAKPHFGSGKVADYIPALACIDPHKFGMTVALGNGEMHCIGDTDEAFSMQSISKIFTLALALQIYGDDLWKRVGREPSGSAFNSIVQLESEKGIPRNPLINAGAIVTTNHLVQHYSENSAHPQGAVGQLLALLQDQAGDKSIAVDEAVALSESETGSRNRSLAHFMSGFGVVQGDIERTLSSYFRQCAVAISCRQLARAALFLAFDGCDPVSGKRVLSSRRCRRINAVMMMSGHYDNSGDFAYRIGLPGKSGVGGGILVVAPGYGTVATWSPGLNEAGTSMVGAIALEELVRKTGWSIFV